MTDIEAYEAEKQALDLLIQRGTSFTVKQTVSKRQKGFWGFFRKKVKEQESLTYIIQEPTLFTLDRIASEQLELSLDEKKLSTDPASAKLLLKKHAIRCARIVAIAILGNDHVNTKELDRLTHQLYKTVKPSNLTHLVRLVDTVGNLGDFINSIRLMSAQRTTMPDRIEESED